MPILANSIYTLILYLVYDCIMLRPILGQSPSPSKQINMIPRSENDKSASTSPPINDCAYCKSNGYDAVGHTKIKCPRLALLSPCMSCGASGINNHTAR